MSDLRAFCKKCKASYSIREYERDRFCKKCNSLLIIESYGHANEICSEPKSRIELPLDAKYLIISVMGPYAGEREQAIFKRKIGEIEENGFTFWHHQSNKANPKNVQRLGTNAKSENELIYFILIKTGSRTSGQDTKKSNQATKFSTRKKGPYKPIPSTIYVETGFRRYALVIRDLRLASGELNLWDYSDYFTKGPVLSGRGASTLCTIKKSSRDSEKKMKSNIREIVAIAEVIEPYSVWLAHD
jgi:hypothetical protein